MSGTTFPPVGPTSLQALIGPLRSYIYKQFEDDDDLQTFALAQNYLAQKWLDDFNNLNLPVWSALSGPLLDWVGYGLYGIQRPTLSYQKPAPSGAGAGPYNTMAYNTLPYNGGRLHPANTNPIAYLPVTDDIYKRILTWHLYSGDGYQFSTRWLKRRVHRFMNGANGFLTPEDNTYDVSITASGVAVTIKVSSNEIGTVLQYAVTDGVLALPFQFTFTVTPTVITFPDAAGGRLSAAAGISSSPIVTGLIAASSAAAAGISGSPAVLRGSNLLVGSLGAAAGMSGDAQVLHAGHVTWTLAGTLAASAGISGTLAQQASLGGTLAATAG